MKRKSKPTHLREVAYSESLNVDREAGVIRNVKILGSESRNGRTYSRKAIAEAATLYEGKKVYVNHPDRKEPHAERKFEDFVGKLQNVQVQEGGVYGDLSYLKSHPLAESIVEAAEKFPEQFGLSHNAEGQISPNSVVESVEAVRSVDIVSEPATNSGLFESYEGGKPVKTKTLREIVATYAGSKGVAILEMEDVAAELDPETEVPVETAEGDAMSGDAQMKQAILTKITDVVNDESLDMKATIAGIKEILKLMAKTVGMPGEGGEAPAEPEAAEVTEEETNGGENTDEVTESLRRELRQLKAKDAARTLLEQKNRRATSERIEAVSAVSQSARTALIESWPEDLSGSGDTGRPRPKQSRPLYESSGNATQPIDAKSYANSLTH